MASKILVPAIVTPGRDRAVNTDQANSVITVTGLNAPSGSVGVADGVGGQNWAGLGAYAAGQGDSTAIFTGRLSHFGPPAYNVVPNQATEVDHAYINPIMLRGPTDLSEILVIITTVFGGAGTEIKFGLWADNGHGWPGARIATGTVAVGAADAEAKIHALSIIVPSGVYYAGVESRDAGLLLLGLTEYMGGTMGWSRLAGQMVHVAGIRADITYANFPPNPYSDTGNTPHGSTESKPTVFLTGTFT